jgi:hypothetical protein
MSGENPSDIINAVTGIAQAISDLLDLWLAWLAGGLADPVKQALKDLLKIAEFLASLAFLYKWGHYSFVVLGAATEKEGYARREYDRLRDNLARGGTPARIYQEKLSKFLDWTLPARFRSGKPRKPT